MTTYQHAEQVLPASLIVGFERALIFRWRVMPDNIL
jgi:hypothetical protein